MFPQENEKQTFEKCTICLNDQIKNNLIDPIIGRDDEILRTITILSRRTKNNPLLIGEPGVGKTAIVEGLAERIIKKDVPDNLKKAKIYSLSVSSILAGAMVQGMFEQRLQNIVNYVKKSQDPIILFIDEIHLLVGAGRTSNGAMDAANILKPALARGEIKFIGATTIVEYRRYIEKDRALERRLQTILVDEPSRDDCLTIMRGLREMFEKHHGLKITDNALKSSVDLSQRYLTNAYWPDKAIDLIDEACANLKIELNSAPAESYRIRQKLINYQMELASIIHDKDKQTITSEERKKVLEKNIEKLQHQLNVLLKQQSKLKKTQENIQKYRQNIDKKTQEIEKLQEMGEYAKAGKILYQELPLLQQQYNNLLANQNKEEKTKTVVDYENIADIIAKRTGIPIKRLNTYDIKNLKNLNAQLTSLVKGQKDAINTVCDTIVRSRLNLQDENRPIGSFIFLGPSGVGKTYLSKMLAKTLFFSENKLIRIDMSEYQEKHSISRLLGPPAGYIGYDDANFVFDKITHNPYCIVLFDEIEKAHPDILNVLLQILDDGIVTNAQNKRINFRNTIIIMTTNIGMKNASSGNKSAAVDDLKQILKPEFLNRIDEFVVFNGLTKSSMKEIAQFQLNNLQTHLAKRNIYVNYTHSLIEFIAKNSGNYHLDGARMMKGFIRYQIENEIAKYILKHTKDKYYLTIDIFGGKVDVKEKALN